MTFNFGAAKGATGFTLPTVTPSTTAPASQVTFGGASGEPAQAKSLFGTQVTSATTTSALSFGSQTATTAPFSFSSATTGTTPTTFTLSAAGTTSAVPLSFSTPVATTSITTTGFPISSTTFSLGTSTATSTTPSFGLLGATTSSAPLSLSSALIAPPLVPSTASILASTGVLTYSQLEDAINKWTLDLEEQGKVFANQAKHLNAWDRLLIGNGEKILNVSGGIERVKQQQQKLDQDLDFVLAQQNELEDCIAPLEKELQDVPIVDTERDQTYKLAENIDGQLKQMSEDLKEIIEHLNESNKAQELSDPVAQIGRILSAHMNSLQWIDRSTSQISSQLDDISKMHDLNKKKVDAVVPHKYNI